MLVQKHNYSINWCHLLAEMLTCLSPISICFKFNLLTFHINLIWPPFKSTSKLGHSSNMQNGRKHNRVTEKAFNKHCCDLHTQPVFNMYYDSSHQWSSMAATMMVSDRRHMLGGLDIMLRPWQNESLRKIKNSSPNTDIHSSPSVPVSFYTHTCWVFIWVHRSLIVSDKFQWGKRDTSGSWK